MKPNGYILYQGPSMLDGKPIVAIVTGLRTKSANTKTGAMLQTWILRADVSPHEAIKTGDDVSICGNCPHRGTAHGDRVSGRSCYVQVQQAPLSVYRAFKRGVYESLDTAEELEILGSDRAVRIGSYGDPLAVPIHVWSRLTACAQTWTGYTHQWRGFRAHERKAWQRLVMASCDTPQDFNDAQLAGWRTFRVMDTRWDNDIQPGIELLCPASKEAGFKSNCAKCSLCQGTTSRATKSVAIFAHGFGASNFNKRAA